MVFHLDLQKQAASGKNKRQARKNKRQARKNKRKSRNKESGAAPFFVL